MAMPPVIPTSFVPHPSISGGPRSSSSTLSGVLTAVSVFFLVLALLAAGGVFAYGRYLDGEKTTQDAALAKAESSVDQGTIESLVQLRDRLASAETLLDNHIALSGLFDLLANVTPTDANFSSVDISSDDSGHLLLTANGTAKSFNALAATSNYFGASSGLKNTIFSNLAINPNGTVAFVLTATLDPSLIAYTGATTAPQQTGTIQTVPPAATSTTP